MASVPFAPPAAEETDVTTGQKRPRLDADRSEADFKEEFSRALKNASHATLVDMLASLGAKYQPVSDFIWQGLDGDLSLRKLFVRNLPFDVEESALRTVMSEFGEMNECTVSKDRATGKGRGFAFVTYVHATDASKAVLAKSRSLEGRDIYFSLATERERGHDAPPAAQPPVMAPPPYAPYGYPPRPPMMMMGAPGSAPGVGGTPAEREIRRFMVRNLSWTTTNDTLRRAFLPYGDVEEAAIPRDPTNGNSRGYGFVVMKWLEGAQAVQMGPPIQIDGRDIQVSIAAAGKDGSGLPAVAAAAAAAVAQAPSTASSLQQQMQHQMQQQQQHQFQVQQHMQLQMKQQQQQQQAAAAAAATAKSYGGMAAAYGAGYTMAPYGMMMGQMGMPVGGGGYPAGYGMMQMGAPPAAVGAPAGALGLGQQVPKAAAGVGLGAYRV